MDPALPEKLCDRVILRPDLQTGNYIQEHSRNARHHHRVANLLINAGTAAFVETNAGLFAERTNNARLALWICKPWQNREPLQQEKVGPNKPPSLSGCEMDRGIFDNRVEEVTLSLDTSVSQWILRQIVALIHTYGALAS